MDTINSQQNYEDLIVRSNEIYETPQPRSKIKKKEKRVEPPNKKVKAGDTQSTTITMSKEVKRGITILAAEEGVRPWIILDRALREYLEKRNSINK